MIECPLCGCRIATGEEGRKNGDCQCSRETMARKIISMESVVRDARMDRELFCASSDKLREQLAARVRYLETELAMPVGPDRFIDVNGDILTIREFLSSVEAQLRPNAKAQPADQETRHGK